MKINVMALTAGLGQRLMPYSAQRAKPAMPFFGVPLLLHAFRHLKGLEVQTLVCNLHHRAMDIRDLLETHAKSLPKTELSDELAKILGSGGAISKARHLLETTENFLVVNGDEVFLPRNADVLALALSHHQESGNLATLVTMEHRSVGKTLGGAWVDQQNNVREFNKKPVTGLHGLHYTGYAFLNRRVFKYCRASFIEENLLYDILMRAMREGGEKVYAFKALGHWFETGNPTDFIQNTEKLLDLLKEEADKEWSLSFKQFLAAHKPYEFLIEKDHPKTKERLAAFLNAL